MPSIRQCRPSSAALPKDPESPAADHGGSGRPERGGNVPNAKVIPDVEGAGIQQPLTGQKGGGTASPSHR
jgi:hypothetical protein